MAHLGISIKRPCLFTSLCFVTRHTSGHWMWWWSILSMLLDVALMGFQSFTHASIALIAWLIVLKMWGWLEGRLDLMWMCLFNEQLSFIHTAYLLISLNDRRQLYHLYIFSALGCESKPVTWKYIQLANL